MALTTRNPNIVSASLQFNGQGLLEVTFVCKGNIEYPSSLNKDYSVFDEPIDAFRRGEETARLLPQYSYNRYNVSERVFTCTSLCLQDGSVYFPEENERQLTVKDKFRVFKSDTSVDQNGIRHVVFSGVGLIGNKPIYPTSLASGKSVFEKTLDAFWDGNKSIELAPRFSRNDERVGWVWETETLCLENGSSIEDGSLVSEQSDIVSYDFPGKLDIVKSGIDAKPSANRKIKIKTKTYLDKNTVKFSAKPYQIEEYATASYCCILETQKGEVLANESKGANGYLAGSAYAASAGNEFLSGIVGYTGLSSYVASKPSYDEFITAFNRGFLLDASASLLFVDNENNKWFLRKEVFVEPNQI